MRVRLLAITAIISGVLVLLGWFTLPVRVAMLIAVAIIIIFRRDRTPTVLPLFRRGSERGWTPYIIPLAAAALAAALLLWHSGTTDPIRSPWSVIPTPFFLLYALLAMMMVVSTVRSSLLTPYFLLLISSLVAILVYPLGFGFDHFIHAAAERIIAMTGALSPPPLFYSGHYGLTVLLADLLPGAGVDLADRLLTPLLTVAFLVPLAYRSLRSVLPDHAARLGLSSLLIVPFLPIAVSTPQATANIFALATMFLLMLVPPPLAEGEREGVYTQTRDLGMRRWIAPLTTAIAALLAQPMTGIIAIAVVTTASLWRWLTKKTRSRFFGQFLSYAFTAVAAAAGAVAIPLAFTIAGRIVPNLDLRVAFDPLPALQRLSSALRDTFAITAMDFATADALAVVRVLLPILWVGLAASGIRTLWRRPTPTHSPSPWAGEKRNIFFSPFARGAEGEREGVDNRTLASILTTTSLIALAAAALVAATVTVPTQLGEEQSQFPLRLVQLASLLATPLAAIGLGALLERVRGRQPQIAAAIAVGAAATFTLLLAYPRDDAQTRSGLWSVSADDIAAVHAIADDAGDAPYVVLANQMLGAAAIRELGFRPSHRVCDVTTEYTNGSESTNACREILAFPLPAGGPIARQFWNYVSQPPLSPVSTIVGTGDSRRPLDREPIDAAMSLVNVNRTYVVLHDYWRNYERLAAATAAIADVEVSQFSHLRIFRLTRGP